MRAFSCAGVWVGGWVWGWRWVHFGMYVCVSVCAHARFACVMRLSLDVTNGHKITIIHTQKTTTCGEHEARRTHGGRVICGTPASRWGCPLGRCAGGSGEAHPQEATPSWGWERTRTRRAHHAAAACRTRWWQTRCPGERSVCFPSYVARTICMGVEAR